MRWYIRYVKNSKSSETDGDNKHDKTPFKPLLPHVDPMLVVYGKRRFPVEVIPNPGTNNNCLGFALGDMLKGDPQDLRDSLCNFMETYVCDKEMRDDMACSILLNFEHIDEDKRFNIALQNLKDGCFIPADLFLAYCERGQDRRKLLRRHNVVFFAERDEGCYEPVCYYLHDSSMPTQYIGCDETHYQQLKMSQRHAVQFDIVFLGVQ